MNQRFLTIPILFVMLLVTLFALPLFDSWLLGVNCMTVALIIVLLFGDTKLALIGGVIGGACMDLLSIFPFGLYMVSYVTMLMIVRQINHTWITNRSLIAYGSLTVISVVVFHLCAYGYGYLLGIADASALTPMLSGTTLLADAVDMLRSLVIAFLVYFIIRLTGHSYATLTRHEF